MNIQKIREDWKNGKTLGEIVEMEKHSFIKEQIFAILSYNEEGLNDTEIEKRLPLVKPGMKSREIKAIMSEKLSTRIEAAIDVAIRYGGIEGDHHKAWVIDQMIRHLTDCPEVEVTAIDCNGRYTYIDLGESEEYIELIKAAKDGEDGPDTHDWDIGIAP
jgi:hypothetical protein